MNTSNLQRPCTFLQGPSHRCALAFHHLWSNVLAWYARETDHVTKQTRGKMKTEMCPEMSVSTALFAFPKFRSAKYQVHHSHVSNKMTISLLSASVDMSGTFKLAVSFASTFQCTSRTYLLKDHVQPFAAGWCQPFLQEQLHADATCHSWQLAQKKETESSPKSIANHAHHSPINDYCCYRPADCGN